MATEGGGIMKGVICKGVEHREGQLSTWLSLLRNAPEKKCSFIFHKGGAQQL